jgi:hypothetical protein
MKISFATFCTNFGVYILHDLQLAMKPVLPSDFILCCLATTKLADHFEYITQARSDKGAFLKI